MTTPPETELSIRYLNQKQQLRTVSGFRSIPMRIPESLRAIGTDGFKICSLDKRNCRRRILKINKELRHFNVVVEENASPDVNNIEFTKLFPIEF